MTTISRTNQVTHSSVTSGGDSGGGDWDHRLNSLLHDLQESVVPESNRGASEYREYRMTSSTRNNDEPPSSTEEKWVEYGNRGGYQERITDSSRTGGITSSTSSTSRSRFESSDRNVGFQERFGVNAGRTYGVDSGLTSTSVTRTPQVEYLTPANTTTELRSGPSSPIGGTAGTEPKVSRKEFYTKASYTTLLKGGPDGEIVAETDRDRIMEELLPPRDFPPMQRQTSPKPAITSSSTSESRREFTESRSTGGTTTTGGYRCPAHDILAQQQQQQKSSYSKEVTSRTSETERRIAAPPPKPIEGLKTPPLVRKVLHSSTASYDKSSYDSRTMREEQQQLPPPTGATQYYSARTTRTETREREMSPVRRFPSPLPPGQYAGEPPKRLDELLATFDESYTHTSRITGDGGGPHKSVPYGPGTHKVRIDESLQSRSVIDESELIQRKTNGHVETKAVSGPPVFYPPGEMFKAEEEMAGKGKAKAKMERQFKAKEKSKQSHSERGGEGAVPVPVCLPVCCAAPCVIQ